MGISSFLKKLFGKAKETVDDVSQKSEVIADAAIEKGKEFGEKAKVKADEMAKDAAEATAKLKTEASEMADKVSAKAKEVVAEVKEEAAPAAKEEKKEEKKEEAAASDVDETVEVPKEFKKLVEQVETMTVLELHELVKVLEKRFGVSASAVAVAGPAAGGDDAEEQSEFTVELTEVGAQKIAVIKAIKVVLGLGLKEAKEMVDGAPTVVKENVKKEDADALKTKLEEAGAKVTLK